MTVLNPTPEELLARQAERQRMLAERAERHRQRHRRFVRRTAGAGGALFLAACWASSFGGHLGWQMVLLAVISGTLLAGVVAAAALGIMRGMLVYGLGCWAAWILGLLCGWWRLINTADVTAAFGPVLVFVSCGLGLVLAGAVFGLVSDTFDGDTMQV